MSEVAEKTRAQRASAPLPEYAERELKIVTKQGNLVPFVFNWAQRYIDAKLNEQMEREGHVLAVILKSRQVGCSTYVAARFFRRIQTRPNQSGMVISDKDARAGKLFKIYERFDTNLEPIMRPMKRGTQRARYLEYGNPDKNSRQDDRGLDSVLEVHTARDKEAGRSETIHVAHASELAYWVDGEDTFVSVSQAIPDEGSEFIIESTPKIAGDLFHQTWQDAVAGENGFVAIFIPWFIQPEYQAPVLSEERQNLIASLDEYERSAMENGLEFEGKMVKLTLEQIQWRRNTYKRKCKSDWNTFKREYPSNPDECWMVSGAAFFDAEPLARYTEQAIAPFRGSIHERIVEDEETGIATVKIEVTPDPNGYIRIWDEPDPLCHYVIGEDTAEGKLVGSQRGGQSERGGRDFSCGQVWDVYNNKLVAQIHGRMAPEVFADHSALLGRYYRCINRKENVAMIGVERNHSSGVTVINRLLDVIGYSKVYMRKEVNKQFNTTTREFGWHTNGQTRPLMLDELAMMLREGIIDLPDADTLREMGTFIRVEDGTPEAQDGCHDDRIMALAIAIQIAKAHGCSSGVMPAALTFDPIWGPG